MHHLRPQAAAAVIGVLPLWASVSQNRRAPLVGDGSPQQQTIAVWLGQAAGSITICRGYHCGVQHHPECQVSPTLNAKRQVASRPEAGCLLSRYRFPNRAGSVGRPTSGSQAGSWVLAGPGAGCRPGRERKRPAVHTAAASDRAHALAARMVTCGSGIGLRLGWWLAARIGAFGSRARACGSELRACGSVLVWSVLGCQAGDCRVGGLLERLGGAAGARGVVLRQGQQCQHVGPAVVGQRDFLGQLDYQGIVHALR